MKATKAPAAGEALAGEAAAPKAKSIKTKSIKSKGGKGDSEAGGEAAAAPMKTKVRCARASFFSPSSLSPFFHITNSFLLFLHKKLIQAAKVHAPKVKSAKASAGGEAASGEAAAKPMKVRS